MITASETRPIENVEQEAKAPSLLTTVGAFIEMTKPRALVMIVYTTVFGYLIAATDTVSISHLLLTAFGVALAGGGSLAVNQYDECELDARMVRTRNRPIPSGRIAPFTAMVFAWTTMLSGYLFLWFVIGK